MRLVFLRVARELGTWLDWPGKTGGIVEGFGWSDDCEVDKWFGWRRGMEEVGG